MPKKKERNYEAFKAEFEKRRQQFGLIGYKVFYESCSLDGCFADIIIKEDGMVAKVRFNNKLPPEDKSDANPRLHAKHEAIHLLIHRLDNLARSRYIHEDEIEEAGEELTRKLEILIP